MMLRPALHSLDEVKLAVDGLREEMAALRWQLDQREQLGKLIAEVAELRAQVGRLEAGARPINTEIPDSEEPVAYGQATDGAVAEPPADSDIGGSSDDTEPAAAATAEPAAQPEPDSPSAIITEFASRTPRRMGRSLFADEG